QEQRQEVDDPAHRDARRIQTQPVDAVDAPFEVEHAAVGADLHHGVPNSDATVSFRRLTPAGVASSTATMPTANTPAASLKSRRNASTTAAIAKPSPMRLIATARPVSPALAAADSSEAPPPSPLATRAALAAPPLVAAPAMPGCGARSIPNNRTATSARRWLLGIRCLLGSVSMRPDPS